MVNAAANLRFRGGVRYSVLLWTLQAGAGGRSNGRLCVG